MPSTKKIYKDMFEFQDSDKRFGIWDGEVVSLADPTRSGMAKVRVFLLHGDKEETPDAMLPWADVNYWGGGYDWGEFDPPPVGTRVHIIFKQGRDDFPVIIGCVRGSPPESQVMRASAEGEDEPIWKTPAGEAEVPKDIFEDQDPDTYTPTRKIWRKSMKGFTILVEEKDGSEFMKIIDRAGQLIEFNCPMSTEINSRLFAAGGSSETWESAQRGSRDATKNNQVDIEQMGSEVRGFIRIQDIAGQEITLDGRSGNEKITIRNQNRTGSRTQTLELSNKAGEEFVQLQDQQGNRILLSSSGSDSMVVEDYRGSQIRFERESGNIIINPKVALTESIRQDRTTTVGGTHTTQIDGESITKVLGNKESTCAGDESIGISGSASVNIGGRVSTFINNIPLGASPASIVPDPTANALEVVAPQGGFLIQSATLGDIQFFNGAIASAPIGGALQLISNGTPKASLLGPGGVTSLAMTATDTTLTGLASSLKLEAAKATLDSPLINIGGTTDFAVFGNALVTWLTSHVHTGVTTGPGSSGPPAAPPTGVVSSKVTVG